MDDGLLSPILGRRTTVSSTMLAANWLEDLGIHFPAVPRFHCNRRTCIGPLRILLSGAVGIAGLLLDGA